VIATTQALQALLDRSEIIRVVQNWGFWRDDGRWEQLRSAYTPDGLMSTTWSVGTAADFVNHVMNAAKKKGGRRSMHFIGATTVDLNGDKAIAETRMVLLVRGVLQGVEVDVTNYGRTHDRFVRHDGQWRIQVRVPIYERDRMDPVDPAAGVKLDPAELARYPYGYRHLAYLQAAEGARITPDLPTPGSAALARLYAEGRTWLTAT
jgi:hypothetical protein